jgi:hypothetical protein
MIRLSFSLEAIMRRFGFLVVICTLLSFIAIPASAQSVAKGKAKGTHTVIGMVKSIDADSITISVVKKKGTNVKNRTIKLTKETTFTVDGKAATIAAVTAGESVKITLSHGHTDQVDVTTKSTTTSTTDTTDSTSSTPSASAS